MAAIDPTDEEMVAGVRRWLNSTKEVEVDLRWLKRTCTLAEKHLSSSGTATTCPTCGGDGKLTDTPGTFKPCTTCAGAGRIVPYTEATLRCPMRMEGCKTENRCLHPAVSSATRTITAQQIHEVYQEEFYRKDKTGKSLAYPTHAELIKAVIKRLVGVELKEPWAGDPRG